MNVSINGPQIYWESSWSVPLLGKLQITASLVDAWIILVLIGVLCWWLGRGLTVENISKKQAVAELLVTTCQNFVNGNMAKNTPILPPLSGHCSAIPRCAACPAWWGCTPQPVICPPSCPGRFWCL